MKNINILIWFAVVATTVNLISVKPQSVVSVYSTVIKDESKNELPLSVSITRKRVSEESFQNLLSKNQNLRKKFNSKAMKNKQ